MPRKVIVPPAPLGLTPEEVARRLMGVRPEHGIPLPGRSPHWSVSVNEVLRGGDSGDLRLDAPYFDPEVTDPVVFLQECGTDLCRLEDLASLDLPGRFPRIWAQDSGHGIPYFNATDLITITALGSASPERFISRESETDLDQLIVRKESLVMTCSGTIGRVYCVTDRIDGWVATHDLIRIRPKTDISGFLLAWLSTPVAKAQIHRPVYGSQVDHINAHHISGLLVPTLPEAQTRAINRSVLDALAARERALDALLNSWPEDALG